MHAGCAAAGGPGNQFLPCAVSYCVSQPHGCCHASQPTCLLCVCLCLSINQLRAGEELKEKQAEAREAQKEAREVARENQAVLRQVSQAEAAIAEAERDVQQVRGRRCTACAARGPKSVVCWQGSWCVQLQSGHS